MQPDLVRALVTEIVQQTFLANWTIYAISAAIGGILAAGGAFLATYFSKRGEQAALRADFEWVKKNLEETTALTESIKADIKHVGERAEKHYWVKREKLEAYLDAVLRGIQWLSAEMQHRFFDAPEAGDDPFDKATMLQHLYLPELDDHHSRLLRAVAGFRTWVGAGMQHRLDALNATGHRPAPPKEHCNQYSQKLEAVNAAALVVQKASMELARELSNV